MKKAFTLSEIILTFGILGFIAIVTLPHLFISTYEHQAKSAVRKAHNTLVEIAHLSVARGGHDYYTITSPAIKGDSSENISNSIFGMFWDNANIDFEKTGPAKYLDREDLYAIFLKDGTAVIYNPSESISADRTVQIGIDKTVGIPIYYDINADKAPNLLSNCRGATTLTVKEPNSTPPIGENCNDRKKRVLKDIYKLRLQATTAIPDDPSVQWIFDQQYKGS